MRGQQSTRWLGNEIWTLATAQHGVVARPQLVGLGVSARRIDGWLADGRLRCVHRGVYLVGHGSRTERSLWMAAVLAGGPGAALSHRCAARLSELIGWAPGRTSISVPAARRPRIHGVAVHRIQIVEPVVIDAIPCTPVSRTILDLAAISRRRTLEKVVEEAVVHDAFDLREILDLIHRVARPRGVRLLRAVLAAHAPGTTLTRSELEEAMLRLCHRLGVPRPVCNGHVALADGTLVEVDFHWPSQRVIVETDGNRYHATHPKRRRDRAKDRALQIAGFIVLRVPEEDLAERPDVIAADLRQALLVRRVDG